MVDDPFEPNSLVLPFETGPMGHMSEQVDADAQFAGGVVVMASVVDVPELGPLPAVVFRFATPTGGFFPALVLVMDDDRMAKLRPLVVSAVQTARREATIRRAAARGKP